MWNELKAHRAGVDRSVHPVAFRGRLRGRAGTFSAIFGDMLFDFSKTNIDGPTRSIC